LYFYTCWVLIHLSKQMHTNSFFTTFFFLSNMSKIVSRLEASQLLSAKMWFFDCSKSQINFEFRVSDSKFRIFLTAKDTKLHEIFS
jgi:hypothetical protein